MYVKKNSWVKHLDFILADLLCINLTLLIAYFLRNGVRNVYALKEYRTLLFAIMALHFCISFFFEYIFRHPKKRILSRI